MIVSDAQGDIRRAYVGGGPGVIVSAVNWFAAAAAQHFEGVATGFTVLFLGGMLIFPLTKLVTRAAFRRANEAPDNPLGMTAMESTIAMIGGLFAAWLLLPLAPTLVMPLAAIAVGTHYAVFKTVYGDRTFWVLSAIITALGVIEILVAPLPGGIVLAVAIVELAFGILLTVRASRPRHDAIATGDVPAR